MKYIYVILLLNLCVWSGYAQKYEATVAEVPAKGYYTIELSQEMIAVADPDFVNLRIYNAEGKETPYFVHPMEGVEKIGQFETFDLIQNAIKDSLNLLVIQNEDLLEINKACIVLGSADVQKYVTIRGSNDQKQWYMVKQRENVDRCIVRENSNEYLNLDFPIGNYKYYEFALSNSQNSPLKVWKVGKVKYERIYPSEARIPLDRFVQQETTHQETYVYFPATAFPYVIHRLVFQVDDPVDYIRSVSLKNSYQNYARLSSRDGGMIGFDAYTSFTSGDTLVIENNDSPPLKIRAVEAYGIKRYVCTYLEKDVAYTLCVDKNKVFRKPHYDMEHLKSEIPADLPVLELSAIRIEEAALISPENSDTSWLEHKGFLWGTLVFIGFLLFYVCWKLMGDLKKRD